MTTPLKIQMPKIYQIKGIDIPLDFDMNRLGTADWKIDGIAKLTAYISDKRLVDQDYPQIGMGVDPGADFGISIFPWERRMLSFHGKLSKSEEEPAFLTYKVMNDILETYIHTKVVVVESAAFGARFGQVSLAERRSGFIVSGRSKDIRVIQVPPATIRRQVLGHGRLTGKDLWITIDQNAADSIPMALLAFSKA